ncbi:MAG: geranylgeranylglycerol-phosphate geranylgeranyltransferase [Bacteroidetes bacterium]|jgi:4-hydroxybenzoate polyprenyltransferase|nr:geranylgeranylglycerol-phosphate geranylgeranyltransferase [Bacteroidota bacterium]
MKNSLTWIKLLRLPNLLIMLLIMLLVRYAIVLPFLQAAGITALPGMLTFSMFMLAVLCTAAAGNIINDIADIEIDRINRPQKLIVGEKIAEKTAKSAYNVFVGLAVLLSISLSILIGNINMFVLIGMVNGLLWFYAQRYKRQFAVGNLVIAFLGGLLVMVTWFFDLFFLMQDPIKWAQATTVMIMMLELVSIYAVFAFMVSLIRELVKDMEDIEGDTKMGCRSVPVVLGITYSTYIVWSLMAIVASMLVWWQVKLFSEGALAAFGFLFLAESLLLMAGVQLAGNPQKKEFAIISVLLKLVMLTGILSILFIQL